MVGASEVVSAADLTLKHPDEDARMPCLVKGTLMPEVPSKGCNLAEFLRRCCLRGFHLKAHLYLLVYPWLRFSLLPGAWASDGLACRIGVPRA